MTKFGIFRKYRKIIKKKLGKKTQIPLQVGPTQHHGTRFTLFGGHYRDQLSVLLSRTYQSSIKTGYSIWQLIAT